MPSYFALDKILVQGTTYTAPADRFYIIQKIGTNSDAGAKLKIDGVDTGTIMQKVAPLAQTTSNAAPLLDLGQLYYVVPPNKTFIVDADSGKKMRIVGKVGKLEPGEQLPAEHALRFAQQGNIHKRAYESSVLYSSDYTWGDGVEITLATLTPRTIEQYIFNDIVAVETGVASFNPGDVGIIFRLDGMPLDMLTSAPGMKGIDAKSMPRPPAGSTNMRPFTLADNPVVVDGDRTLTIVALNQSGGNLTVAATTDQYITAIVEYRKKA